MKYSYKCIALEQTPGGKRLAFFAAPATDISKWGGIPQKKRFDSGEENAGFQREENLPRVKSIAEFMREPRNTVQNPLLCSMRVSADCSVSFVSLEGEPDRYAHGSLEIEIPDFSSWTLLDLFTRVKAYLEARVPDLAGKQPSEKSISRIQELARGAGVTFASEDSNYEENVNGENADDGNAAIFDQSNIAEFWEEVAARKVVLEKIGSYDGDEFLGFNRDALESYLKPVVVVDGQHRLKGALLAANNTLSDDEARSEIESLVDSGVDPDLAEDQVLAKNVRLLPVTLLMDSDPAEHVFQFVVVNQKATPIGRALLGTIVSTSLTDTELEGVAGRLRDAGIPLDESRAASFMARHKESPFCGCVELGMANDNANSKLPWAVFVSIVNIFKELKGATPFHESNDYAALWKRSHLDDSNIVSDFSAKGFETPFEYWHSNEGPWKEVFICFWNEIKNRFASTSDDQRRNYWGNPRRSNLFNKVSLNILVADFFKYLRGGRITLDDIENLKSIIDSWLQGVDKEYFDRDWELEKSGVKKDSPGIRHKWAKIWDEYRSSPDRLPDRRVYRTPSVL